jgi:hypothetical protein
LNEDKIFQECLAEKLASNGKPFWNKIFNKYPEKFKNPESARNWFRKQCKKRKIDLGEEENLESTSYEETNDFINVICSSKRVLSKEDILKQFNIDENIWEVQQFKVKTSEGYRKDRSVEWHVLNGKVNTGDVSDSGKMLVVPLYHVEVKLIKKKKEFQAKNSIQQMIEDAKNFAPLYQKIEYKNFEDGCLYEIAMPDIHFGRLSWNEESGENYDIKIAKDSINKVLDELLTYSKLFNINKILLPIGNDFYNVDNKMNTTTAGTPQQEDTRWQKTFRKGRELLVGMIDKCSQIAPVDILIVSGNHDEQRSFYIGEVLECWYHNNQNVSIDNRARTRKYYQYGKNLIGFTHGSNEKLDKLPLLMANEEPVLWAKTKYREIHTGDKHFKKDINITFATDEGQGMVIRILRSLAVADAWTFNKGFVGSLRAAEGFLWHPENGLIAQLTATP